MNLRCRRSSAVLALLGLVTSRLRLLARTELPRSGPVVPGAHVASGLNRRDSRAGVHAAGAAVVYHVLRTIIWTEP